MKTIVFANQKGGVGKTAVLVQLAYYFSLSLKQRVLVLDLDHQRNTTKAIMTGQLGVVSMSSASHVFEGRVATIETGNLVLVSADKRELLALEKQGGRHNSFATNLQAFLKSIEDDFDLVLIDTNPNPDIRQLSALVVSDFVLSPLQLNQEAIDGIGSLLNDEKIGIRKIKSVINPKLELIGILPNLVEPTPFQRDNLKQLSVHYAKLLIPMTSGGFAAIKKSTAIAEAQAVGLPVWKLGKTSGREAWAQLKPVFDQIWSIVGVP